MRATWVVIGLGCVCCGAQGISHGDAGGGSDSGTGDGGIGGDPRLGAHTLAVDAYGNGHAVLTTRQVQTQPSGSTFVAVVGYHQPGTVSDSKGNTWATLGTPITFSSEAGSYFAAFACASCRGGSGHTFSFTKAAGDNTDEATLMVIEVVGGEIGRAS